jgi:hypothetical protein
MILLNKEQRDYIAGYYGEDNVLEPIRIGENEWALPETVLFNEAFREIWDYLKVLPCKLYTGEEISQLLIPFDPEIDETIYSVAFRDGIVCSIVRICNWNSKVLTVEVNVSKSSVGIKRIQLRITNEDTIEGVGEYDYFMGAIMQGVPLFTLAEQMLLMRQEYIIEKSGLLNEEDVI